MSAHTIVNLERSYLAPGGDAGVIVHGTFTGSASYDAGGSLVGTVTGKDHTVRTIHVHPVAAGTTYCVPVYTPGTTALSAVKVALYQITDGAQLSGDLHTATFAFTAVCDGATA